MTVKAIISNSDWS